MARSLGNTCIFMKNFSTADRNKINLQLWFDHHMTVCDRANFLAETLTQVHRSGQDNVFCAESCQLKHILRNSDLYHNRMTTIFLAKLFPLYWVHLMYSTHVITRVLVKETSSKLPPTLNPSYTRRTWWKFWKWSSQSETQIWAIQILYFTFYSTIKIVWR